MGARGRQRACVGVRGCEGDVRVMWGDVCGRREEVGWGESRGGVKMGVVMYVGRHCP